MTNEQQSYDPNDAKSIFLRAAELTSRDEQQQFVARVCEGKPELQARVEILLKTALDPDSLLDQPASDLGPTCITQRSGSQETKTVPLDFLTPSTVPNSLGRLGGYEILEVIGRGGMGVVLRAMDAKLNRVVAIKVLAPELAGNAQARRRFLREAQAAAAVSHDHVVTIHAVDDGSSDPRQPPFLVMECIVGQSLQQKIDKVGALGLKEILRIGMQIASGLTAAHKQGLVHRDIKPANILLENGVQRVKITDFGLARATDDVGITQTGQIAGTPQYMSPEQAQGHPVDYRSDLFSLGSVLYTMSTGRPAFRADSAVAVLRRVCDDTPRPIGEVNAEIPDWLIAIIERLMAKKPEDRFSSANEVSLLLEQSLAHVQQPDAVPQPPLIQALLAKRTKRGGSSTSTLGLAWNDFWSERDRWFTIAVQSVLILLHLVCMICFVSFHLSRQQADDGRITFLYQLGVPNPWYRFEVYPEPNVPFRSGFHPFAWSVVLGLVGCLFYYTYWRIEKVRTPKMNRFDRPAFMLGLWAGGAIIAVGIGQWLGFANLKANPVATMASISNSNTSSPGPEFANTPSQSFVQLVLNKEAPPVADAPFNADDARKRQEAWARYLGVPIEVTNRAGMKFRLIPPGRFLMGATSREQEQARKVAGSDARWVGHIESEGPQNSVRITMPFYLGVHEVTQAEYQAITGMNPSRFKVASSKIGGVETSRLPVESITWADAVRFCQSLGPAYRLPTEAEWEFACRAGTDSTYWSGQSDESLLNAAWIGENSNAATHPVGEKRPNPFGLTDMHGNVWEWVQDAWTANAYGQRGKAGIVDPVVSGHQASPRVLRGGDFTSTPSSCRSAHRHEDAPTAVYGSIGFRVVMSVDGAKSDLLQLRNGQLQVRDDQSTGSASESRPTAELKLIKRYIPGEDQPVPPSWADQQKAVAVQQGTWRFENSVDGGNFHVLLPPILNGIPHDGIIVFRAKIKLEPHHELAWGDLQLGDWGPDHFNFQWPKSLYDYRGKVAEWTQKEVRYPAKAFHSMNPPQIVPRFGLHANGLLWVRDVEVLHLVGDHRRTEPHDIEVARTRQQDCANAINLPVEFTDEIGMKFRLIPAGRFQMGCSSDEIRALSNLLKAAKAGPFEQFTATSSGPKHLVEISKPFYMGTYEVTAGQFRRFIEETQYKTTGESKPDASLTWKKFAVEPDSDNRPVCGVSWDDATAFCKWLSEKTGKSYSLPTEAQWEYACRAGTETIWSFGDDELLIGDFANVGPTNSPVPPFVGLRSPNPFGLYDMHGNVDEWCLDWHKADFYGRSPSTDPVCLDPPTDPASGKIARGGAWNSASWWSRSTTRTYDFPSNPAMPKGFRVVINRSTN